MIQYLKQNEKRILIVGDIHGCLTKFLKALNSLGYNKNNDLLISVGDLVDRGPENLETLKWFKNNNIPISRGNHDDFVANAVLHDHSFSLWLQNGGTWAVDEDFNFIPGLKEYAVWLDTLPFLIEIELDCGELAGVVHAECWDDWDTTKSLINDRITRNRLTWSRTKIQRYFTHNRVIRTEGVKWLFTGHSVVTEPLQVGNQFYLDTGAVFDKLYNSEVPGAFSFAIIEPNATEVVCLKI